MPGGALTYVLVASNAGPSDALAASVNDSFPSALTCSWICVFAGGDSCATVGTGDIHDTVNLRAGHSVTYTANCVVAESANGFLINTASLAPSEGVSDPVQDNNSASDTDTILAAVATIPTLSSFALALFATVLVLLATLRLLHGKSRG